MLLVRRRAWIRNKVLIGLVIGIGIWLLVVEERSRRRGSLFNGVPSKRDFIDFESVDSVESDSDLYRETKKNEADRLALALARANQRLIRQEIKAGTEGSKAEEETDRLAVALAKANRELIRQEIEARFGKEVKQENGLEKIKTENRSKGNETQSQKEKSDNKLVDVNVDSGIKIAPDQGSDYDIKDNSQDIKNINEDQSEEMKTKTTTLKSENIRVQSNNKTGVFQEIKPETEEERKARVKAHLDSIKDRMHHLPDEELNREIIYEARRSRLERVCRENKLIDFKRNFNLSEAEIEKLNPVQKIVQDFKHPVDKSILYNEGHHLSYCWIHKVASTSWNSIFYQLANAKMETDMNLHKAAQKFKPNNVSLSRALSADSIRFLIVRHPFERLVSAFVDKFEQGRVLDYIFKTFNRDVFRANKDEMENIMQRPTFSQFVKYILELPNLDEFNDHWIPYWAHCHACRVRWDVIARLDTLTEDSNYIAEKANLTTGEFNLPWKNVKGQTAVTKQVPKYKTAVEYFKNELSEESIRGLYEIYRLDFDMFGYSASEYLEELP